VVIKSSDDTVLRDSGWLPANKILNGPVYTNDLTTLQNDQYTLELLVRNNYQTVLKDVSFILNSPLKLGVFTFSQQDLVVPAGGVPLAVVRTYNSLNPNLGKFGYSWTYALNDLNVTFSEDRGFIEPLDIDEAGPGYTGTDFSMRVGGSRDITMTLPNGQRTTFYYYEQARGEIVYPFYYSPPGLRYTLRPVNENGTDVGGYDEFTLTWHDAGANSPHDAYDFPAYILTDTSDGTEYFIQREYVGTFDILNGGDEPYIKAYDDNTRLAWIKKASGEKIVISSDTPSLNGGSQFSINYLAANGQTNRSVYFQLNSSGQISAVMDPASGAGGLPVVKYEYDAYTNLFRVESLANRLVINYTTNTYLYQNGKFPHFLTEILNSRGVPVARNLYDNTGKLIGVVDAEGRTNLFSYNVGSQTETTFDRMGNPTTYAYDNRGNVITQIDALNHVTQSTYDGNNNLTSTTDALTNTTYYTYDNNGNRTQVVDSMNRTNFLSYDANGNLLGQTDPVGNLTTNMYDNAGNQTNTAQFDPHGNLLQQSASVYVDNRLTQTFNGNGQLTASFSYDGSGNLTKTTDANGLSHNLSYDANGNQTSSSYVWVAPGGGQVNVSNQVFYDPQSRVIMTIDNEGNTNQTFYTDDGKVSYNIDKFGNTNSFIYDAAGNLIQTVFPTGTFNRAVYDGDGRRIMATDQNGISGTFTFYDAIGRVTNTIRATNVVINLQPDPNNPGQMISVVGSTGVPISTNSTSYYDNGWVKSRTDAAGQTTSYTYWPDGQTETVTDPLGHSIFYNYDNVGRRQLVWDAANHGTRFLYDAGGRTVSMIFDDGTSVSNIFNNVGQKVGTVDQAGLETQFGYDAIGQLTNVIKPQVLNTNGQWGTPSWAYTYDQYGRPLATADPYSRTTTNYYDAVGRQLGQRLPMGETNLPTMFYANGKLWKQYDFNGQMVEHRYDNFGRETNKYYFVAGQTQYPSNSVTYSYNQLGQLTNVIQRYGGDASSNYSPLADAHQIAPSIGEKLMAKLNCNPELSGGLTVVPLLALGMALVPRDKRQRFGVALKRAFDTYWVLANASTRVRGIRRARRVSRLRMPSLGWRLVASVLLFAFIGNQPGLDQLWTAHAACVYPNNYSTATTRITGFSYDVDGHLTQVNSPEGVINYDYDLATGRLAHLCTTNSEALYGYDQLGRLQTVTVIKRNGQPTNETTTYHYDVVGNRSEVDLPNGVVSTYRYDDLNRLTNLVHQAGVTNLAVYTYQLDKTGRRTNAIEVLQQEGGTYQTNTLNWQYDGMYRLTNEINVTTSPGGTYAYTNAYQYDLVGNRVQKIRTGANSETDNYIYNLNDELTSEQDGGTAITYHYDNNGSLTNKTSGSTVNSYTYDTASKLNGVYLGGSLVASYLYNDQGIRVQSIVNGVTTHYLIDNNNHTGYAQVLEEELGVSLTPNMSYVIGDDVLAQCGPAGMTPSYFLQDGHGNNRQMVQVDNTVFKHYSYDTYGNVQTGTIQVPVSSTTADSAPTTKLFCGEQYDSSLQMYNLRARYYNPINGRFNQSDTFKGDSFDPQSLHKYTYANCDPCNQIDPSGLESLGELLIVSGVIGLLAAGLGAAVFHATGGSAVRGAIIGFIAGFSFAFAFFEGKLPLAVVLAFAQGFGAAAVAYLASVALGHEISGGQVFQTFAQGFAFGAANAAFGGKIPPFLLSPLLSVFKDLISVIFDKNPPTVTQIILDALVAFVLSAIITWTVDTQLGGTTEDLAAAKWFVTQKPVEAEQIIRAGLGMIVGVAVGMYIKLLKDHKDWLRGW
jgi:RHS repeat-associated protein